MEEIARPGREAVKRKYLILVSLSGWILSVDQLTKNLAYLYLKPGESSALLGRWLRLELSQNAGFAFGLIQRAPDSMQGVFFLGVPVFALVLIVLIFIKLQDNDMRASIALTTLLAGAVGNLIDRVQYGYVVDFARIATPWGDLPGFNVADVSITIGVALVVWNTFRSDREQGVAG